MSLKETNSASSELDFNLQAESETSFHEWGFQRRLTIKKGLNSFFFKWSLITVLVFNYLITGLAVDYEIRFWKSNSDSHLQLRIIFLALEGICMVIYIVEFILRVYTEYQNLRMQKNLLIWHGFLVATGSVSFFVSLLNMLGKILNQNILIVKIFYLARVVRILRLVEFFKSFRILVKSFIQTVFHWLLCLGVLTFTLLFCFSVVGHILFTQSEDKKPSTDWIGFYDCLVRMACYFTADSWTDVDKSLEDDGYTSENKIFAVICLFILNFIIFQIFIAVTLLKVDIETQQFKESEQFLKKRISDIKKDYMMSKQNRAIKEMKDNQKKLGKTVKLKDIVNQVASSIKHSDLISVSDLSTHLSWMEMFYLSLINMEHSIISVQELQYELADLLASGLELKLGEEITMKKSHDNNSDPFTASVPFSAHPKNDWKTC